MSGPGRADAVGGDPAGPPGRLRHLLALPVEDRIGTALMGALLLLMATNVFLRFVMNTGISWSEEISRLLLIWIVYFGIASGIRSGTHIRVDLIDRLVTAQVFRVVQLFATGSLVVYLVLVAVLYVQIVTRFSGLSSPASGLSMAWSYGAVLTGAVLGLLRLIQMRGVSSRAPH